MQNLNNILAYLQKNKERFREEFGIVKIGVFGSFARGEQTENSDLDIIVEFKDPPPNLFLSKRKLKAELNTTFNTNVDICREKYIKPIFKKMILNDAKYA